MEAIEIKRIKDIKLNNPIIIEGLPGVGHVGKLVAEHIVEQLGAEKIIEIYSSHFPPQVIVNSDGTIKLVNNEIYAHKADDGGQDLLIIVGDHQSATNEGHYELCSTYISLAEEFGVKMVYTLGGYGTGELSESTDVIGAVNNIELVEQLKSAGVTVGEQELNAGIIGVSGLLLGMCMRIGLDAACLMGVTSGYMVDPKSAQSVLQALGKLLGIEFDMHDLEERAVDMMKIVEKLQDAGQNPQPELQSYDEDLRYIG